MLENRGVLSTEDKSERYRKACGGKLAWYVPEGEGDDFKLHLIRKALPLQGIPADGPLVQLAVEAGLNPHKRYLCFGFSMDTLKQLCPTVYAYVNNSFILHTNHAVHPFRSQGAVMLFPECPILQAAFRRDFGDGDWTALAILKVYFSPLEYFLLLTTGDHRFNPISKDPLGHQLY
jgi:hypothetical protein